MAGKSAERQETKLVAKINSSVKKNGGNPINLVSKNGFIIQNVTGAKKYMGRQATGSEPYTDVMLRIGKTNNFLSISMKGESAPSLAGGGLRGIELISPGLGAKFFKEVYNHLVKKIKLPAGSKVPDVYGEIPKNVARKLIVGNRAMGGPIDYMYIGPMDVSGNYDPKTNRLLLNGNFTAAIAYANKYTFYFRLRARREDQRFDPNAKSGNVPKIYSKSKRGDSAGRLVIVEESTVPKKAMKIKLR